MELGVMPDRGSQVKTANVEAYWAALEAMGELGLLPNSFPAHLERAGMEDSKD
jgi:hypothetical protein